MRAVAAAMRTARLACVRVPTPHAELCTARVLVMERLDGTPLGAAEPLLARLGPSAGRRSRPRCSTTVLDQVLVHGLFHVDLHPGNVLVERRRHARAARLRLGRPARRDDPAAIGRLLAALGRADSVAATRRAARAGRPARRDRRAGARTRPRRADRPLRLAGLAPPAPPRSAALFRLVTVAPARRPAAGGGGVPDVRHARGHADRARPRSSTWSARAREVGRRAADRGDGAAAGCGSRSRTSWRRCCRCCAGCRGGSTGSPTAVEHGRLSVNVRLFADARDRRVPPACCTRCCSPVLGAAAGLMAVLLLGTDGGPQVTESRRAVRAARLRPAHRRASCSCCACWSSSSGTRRRDYP